MPARGDRGFAHGVEGRGADIAEYDAQRPQGEAQLALQSRFGGRIQDQIAVWVPSSTTLLGGRL